MFLRHSPKRIKAASLDLFLLLLIVVTPAWPDSLALGQQNPKVQEVLYYGVIETPAAHLRTVLIIHQESQKPSGWLVSPDQSSRRFELEQLQLTDSALTFSSQTLKCKYEGQRSAKDKPFEGKFQQGGGTFPLTLSQVSDMPPDKPSRIWKGTLNAILRKLDLQFRQFESPDGQPYQVFDSLNENVKGLHATVTREGDHWEWKIPAVRASFDAVYDSKAQTLTGKWKQAGLSFDLKMTAVSESEGPARPQTPQPPFPYQSQDVQFPGGQSDVQLAGTLTLPASSTGQAVILISGSGPQDRNETILEHQIFAVLADYLTRQGVTVLRYDDRGVGQSTGDFASATTEDFAADAAAALKFLRSRVPNHRYGIIGHSEGGMVGPMVAQQHPGQVDFLVLLAGPAVAGQEIIRSQTQLLLAASGAQPAALKQAAAISNVMLDVVQSASPDQSASQLLEAIAEGLFRELPEADRKLLFSEMGDKPLEQLTPSVRQSLQGATSPWYRFFIQYDPAPTLKQLTCPVLALFGSRDLQVDPTLNQRPMKQALQHDASQVIIMPKLNHLFQECERGTVDEYYSIAETFSPKAMQQILNWMQNLPPSPSFVPADNQP